MTNVFVQFTVDFVCKCHRVVSNSNFLLLLSRQQTNMFSDNSNNFLTNHRRSQTDDTLEFISRVSNIMQQSDEMTLMNQATFLK